MLKTAQAGWLGVVCVLWVWEVSRGRVRAHRRDRQIDSRYERVVDSIYLAAPAGGAAHGTANAAQTASPPPTKCSAVQPLQLCSQSVSAVQCSQSKPTREQGQMWGKESSHTDPAATHPGLAAVLSMCGQALPLPR